VEYDCAYVEQFIAYKCTEASIVLVGPSTINRGEDIVSIDTRYGPAILPGKGSSELINSESYGEFADN
jgi:hypothetical protein